MTKPDAADLKNRLTAEQFEVTQNKGTERPFTGEYYAHADDGTYRCVCCDAELFSSETKFDAGCGWPSFWLPLAGEAVKTVRDTSHGMIRDEVVCSECGRTSDTYSRMARNRRACDTALIRHHSTSRRNNMTFRLLRSALLYSQPDARNRQRMKLQRKPWWTTFVPACRRVAT